MNKKHVNLIAPVLGVTVFTAALLVLHHELKVYHYHDIVRSLHGLPTDKILSALALTMLGYLALTGYDTLSLRYIRAALPYRKAAFASFVGYSFSHNAGFSILSSAPVRFRLYSSWGLSAVDVTTIVAMNGVTFWTGFCALGGAMFLVEPLTLPASVRLPFASLHLFGALLLLAALSYVVLCATFRKPVRLREWEFHLPAAKLGIAQVLVSSIDWALASGVLYVLLPASPGLNYPAFVGVFLLAQVVGLASQVPGGLGVFEAVVVLLLSTEMPASEVISSLIAFRAVYYILPLCTASLLLGGYEAYRRKDVLKRLTRSFGAWTPGFTPDILALIVFAGGAVLMFSGATPSAPGRLAMLREILPMPVIEASHFMGSVTGMCLVILARGLRRRLDAAYFVTAALLAAGVVFSLLKGFDYEEALVLSVTLTALYASRRHFYRHARLFTSRFTPRWDMAALTVIICSVWLGLFSYKHVAYSQELWWRFSVEEDAPRFLRATVGVVGAALIFALARLLRPAPPSPSPPEPDDMDAVRAVVGASPCSNANLALLGDKTLLFNDDRSAFVMYGVEGRSHVSLGSPVGPSDEHAELAWRFRELADRDGGWTVFYEVGKDDLHLYLDMGLNLLKLGEEARVRLEPFSLDGGKFKHMRHDIHRLEEEGYTFEIVPKPGMPALMPQMKAVSDAWLAGKNTREKGFSLGFFSEAYLMEFPAGVVMNDGAVVAFTNIWAATGREELSVDLMRRMPDAPPGMMDYLFVKLMLWGRDEGYRWFNLGMAPLSGLEDRALAPFWNRLASLVYRHGEHFYNFQGLRNYKEKFGPEWSPKYLASPGGLALPVIMTNIAALVSRGLKGVVTR